MSDSFVRKSNLTHNDYDYFKTIKILNIQQVAFYLENEVPLIDVRPSKDYKTNKPVLVFYFNREDTKEAYDLWCKKHE